MAMFGRNWLEDEEDDGAMVPSSWKEDTDDYENCFSRYKRDDNMTTQTKKKRRDRKKSKTGF